MGIFDLFRKKKNGDSGSSNEEDSSGSGGGTMHCFVLCGNEKPGDLSRCSEVAKRVLGRGYTADIHKGEIVTIYRGKETLGFISHLPMPIPGGEAEANAEGNLFWPDGLKEAAQHRSHLIVTTLGSKTTTPLESMVLLSRLTLVALELFQGIGVYWGNGSISNSRKIFEEFCSDFSNIQMLVAVWMRLQIVRASDNQFGMYTLGMHQFGLMEIEIERSPFEPMKMFEFVTGIAAYLIANGPVIADGNTVGGSPTEKILVRHRPSMIDAKRKVYRIIFS